MNENDVDFGIKVGKVGMIGIGDRFRFSLTNRTATVTDLSVAGFIKLVGDQDGVEDDYPWHFFWERKTQRLISRIQDVPVELGCSVHDSEEE